MSVGRIVRSVSKAVRRTIGCKAFRLFLRTSWVKLVLLLSVGAWPLQLNAMEDKPKSSRLNFAKHAKPVFRNHCVSCHNPNRTSGDLDLTNYVAMMQGGSSGDVIEPGSPDDSFLFQLITHADSPEMPPGDQKIPDEDIEVIRKWIEDGAINRPNSKPVSYTHLTLPTIYSV